MRFAFQQDILAFYYFHHPATHLSTQVEEIGTFACAENLARKCLTVLQQMTASHAVVLLGILDWRPDLVPGKRLEAHVAAYLVIQLVSMV